MTQSETLLWNRLKSFELDQKEDQLTFSQRLARENGWNRNYTLRVITEYKKFLFLCCTSPHPVTPSDPVDQAWHLHLTYTKSYWNDLCKNTLEREIHHNPTKGGAGERKKFDSLYTGAHGVYIEKFGAAPPDDIWHDNKTRFSEIDFQRVNLSRYWLVKKPSAHLRQFFLEAAILLMAMLHIQSVGTGFLILFFIGLAIAAAYNKPKGGGGNSAGSNFDAWSCSSDSGDSGCSSNSDSGCSSGCSGCGGGCGD